MLLFGALGMQEMILIFVVILLLFGADRLPELARGLGKGIREFKKATNEIKKELDVEPIRREIEEEINRLDEPDDAPSTSHSTKTKDKEKK